MPVLRQAGNALHKTPSREAKPGAGRAEARPLKLHLHGGSEDAVTMQQGCSDDAVTTQQGCSDDAVMTQQGCSDDAARMH